MFFFLQQKEFFLSRPSSKSKNLNEPIRHCGINSNPASHSFWLCLIIACTPFQSLPQQPWHQLCLVVRLRLPGDVDPAVRRLDLAPTALHEIQVTTRVLFYSSSRHFSASVLQSSPENVAAFTYSSSRAGNEISVAFAACASVLYSWAGLVND